MKEKHAGAPPCHDRAKAVNRTTSPTTHLTTTPKACMELCSSRHRDTVSIARPGVCRSQVPHTNLRSINSKSRPSSSCARDGPIAVRYADTLEQCRSEAAVCDELGKSISRISHEKSAGGVWTRSHWPWQCAHPGRGSTTEHSTTTG